MLIIHENYIASSIPKNYFTKFFSRIGFLRNRRIDFVYSFLTKLAIGIEKTSYMKPVDRIRIVDNYPTAAIRSTVPLSLLGNIGRSGRSLYLSMDTSGP